MKFRALAAVVVPLALLGCTGGDDGRFDPSETPGGDAWNHDTNVACTTSDECGTGEVCEDGVCQMARCAETYESLAPMGSNHYFGTDGEFAVISDDTFIDAFEPSNQSYINSWDLEGEKVVDVAGGNLTGSRPQGVAVALQYSSTIRIGGGAQAKNIDVGFWPKFIAAGDVDADSTDELVAFSEDGEIAVCEVAQGYCSKASIGGVSGKDVAVADVDGDGFAEPLFLIDEGGKSQIIVWNLDSELTGQEESYGWVFNFPVRAMGAGHISGKNSAEIATLEDGGWWGWTDDKVHIFSPASDSFVASKNVDGHTEDIAIGDRNSDDKDEIAVLREAKKISLYRMNDAGDVVTVSETSITVGNNPQRISMVDWDGNSASGRLVEGPELVAGKAVPVAALLFPPYPHKLANGALSANITMGNTETSSESLSDTVSLTVGMGVGFGAEAGIFKAKVGAHFSQGVAVTHTLSKSMQVGARYWILADPDLYGNDYAPIIMSCGCYHRYRYETEDPSGLIGGSGQFVDIFVPVGGQTQLWSSKRYNAMAEATGTVPKIELPVRVGDVASYPQQKVTLTGEPVLEEDMVFPDTPVYQVSDVGFVNFWLLADEEETNATAVTTTFGVSSSFGALGAEVNTEVSLGVTQGYSLSVGKNVIFTGGTPPIPDDPSTPEDEFELHRYTYSPYVYRHRYIDAAGDEAGFYVMHYAVGH